MPIGAYVLDGRSAGSAGNPREALHSGQSPFDRMGYHPVPIFSCIDGKSLIFGFDPAQSDPQHEAGEAGVGHQEVATAAEDEQRQLALRGKGNARNDVLFARRLCEPARRAADLEGRVGGEGNFLKELHLHQGKSKRLAKAEANLYNQTSVAAFATRSVPIGASMYPEIMVIPMREELTRAGIKEVRTAEEVDSALAKPGTTLLVVNSICGCAAGKMRPGVRLALQNKNLPDQAVTVFAGQDREATERARSYFEGHPPTSPAIAILRDGKLVYLMQRSAIETATAPLIAQELTRAMNELCSKTTA